MRDLIISDNRQELMGIAVISVLVCHLFSIPEISTDGCLGLFHIASQFVFVSGFFFLSGYGNFCSLKNDDYLKRYYLKRIKHVLIPYVLLSVPFLLFLNITESSLDFFRNFLQQVTTFYFWSNGNYYGMWYLSTILLLYAISPAVFRIGKLIKSHTVSLIVTIIISFSILLLLFHYNYQYYESHIFLWHILAYWFGMCYSNFVIRDNLKGYIFIFLLPVVSGVVSAISLIDWRFHHLQDVMCPLSWMVIFALLLCCIKQKQLCLPLIRVLSWLGNNSLHIYILHLLICAVITEFFPLPRLMAISLSIVVTLAITNKCKRYTDSISEIIINRI